MKRIKTKLKVYDGYTREIQILRVPTSKFSYRDINCFLNKKIIFQVNFYDQKICIRFKEKTKIRLNAECIKRYISLCKC